MLDAPKQQELRDLLARLTEGELSEVERRRLAELLQDPDARAVYRRYLNVHALLEWRFSPSPILLEPGAADPPVIVQPASRVAAAWQRSAARVQESVSLWMMVSLMLTVVGIGALLVWIVPRGSNDPADAGARPAIAARLTGVADVIWSEDATRWKQGVLLAEGRRLRLESGLVELTFADQAKVILQGPCDFVIGPAEETDPQGSGVLGLGRLTAHVPKQAVGFTIDTPNVRIVDLGTEFGVEVNDEGYANVLVFEGAVDAAPTGESQNERRRLTAGQSARVGPDGFLDSGKPTDEQFVRALPRAVDKAELTEQYAKFVLSLKPDAYYRMESTSGMDVHDSGPAARHGAVKFGNAPFSKARPWQAGRFGNALYSAGSSQPVFASVPFEPAPANQLTLTAWVLLNSRPTWGMIASDWSDWKNRGRGQFHFGLHGDHGDLKLTVAPRNGSVVGVMENGKNPLPLGVWHHVVFVVNGARATIYRNGQATASAACRGIIAPSADSRLNIGSLANDAFWNGSLDEIAFFHRALSAEEIKSMYEAGSNQ